MQIEGKWDRAFGQISYVCDKLPVNVLIGCYKLAQNETLQFVAHMTYL